MVWIERNDLGNWDSGMVKDAPRNSHVLYLSTQNSLLYRVLRGGELLVRVSVLYLLQEREGVFVPSQDGGLRGTLVLINVSSSQLYYQVYLGDCSNGDFSIVN